METQATETLSAETRPELTEAEDRAAGTGLSRPRQRFFGSTVALQCRNPEASKMPDAGFSQTDREVRTRPSLALFATPLLAATLARAPEAGEFAEWQENREARQSEYLKFHPTIQVLPRPARHAATFEPHWRALNLARLLDLFERFKGSYGSVETAARLAHLNLHLTDMYKKSLASKETRNFATALSVIQDFLRPHWSQLSIREIEGLCECLRWLNIQIKVTPGHVERFQRRISSVLGGHPGIEIAEEESEEVS